MPPNVICIENKLALKMKHNSVYQVPLVAFRYNQVLGINFSENYSLVKKKIAFHILLLMVIHFGYSTNIVDIEATFLYRELEEEIYMEFLQGMSDVGKDDCIILNNCIYILVQATKQYYKKAIKN